MVHSLPLNAPPPHDLEEARPVASCNRCSLPQRGEGTQLVTGLCVDIPPRSLQFKCPQFLPHCCALIYSSSVLQFIVYHCTAGGGRWGIILRAISWFFFFSRNLYCSSVEDILKKIAQKIIDLMRTSYFWFSELLIVS